ncbi:DUF1127 domain-containing protein [Enterovirga aerilata]|uniref:DUF1127 domain-containing protein n=1 Tax=Enterovirga aerilata TaxID=2730920 RepID=A0A849ICG1_9HYPH|nr:DUF1127 domain-containing protein [Enterovirga sp. DB1703]NNM71613.1 DUF1127 domain-containing protein [Enterovirga sp. DB1703]
MYSRVFLRRDISTSGLHCKQNRFWPPCNSQEIRSRKKQLVPNTETIMLFFIFKALARSAERRRLHAELHQLSDATLKDIGLTRHDLRRGLAEAAEPLEATAARLHRHTSSAKLKLVARVLIVGSLVVSPGQSRAEAFLAWFDQNAAESSGEVATSMFYGGGHWHAYGTNPKRTQPREFLDQGGQPSLDGEEASPARGFGPQSERTPTRSEPAREQTAR